MATTEPSEAHQASTTVHGARGDASDDAPANVTPEPADDDSSVDHVDEKAPPKEKLGKRQWIKQHCSRFWPWYVLGTIIFLAIFLPILFTLIIPAIVQDIINSQKLPVLGGNLQVLSPDSLEISLHTQIDSGIPAKTDPLTLQLYNKNATTFSPFVDLHLPELHISGTTDAYVNKEVTKVLNETELIKWFNDVFDNEEVKLSVKAHPTVRLGELTSHPTLDKTITIPGLNKLYGFGIADLTVMLPPDTNGNNIKGTLNIPNACDLTLGFGNLTLDMFSGDLNIGHVVVYNVTLPPGNNTKKFDGMIKLPTVLGNLGKVLKAQEGPLQNGMIQLNTTGKYTVYNGKRINYIEQVLNKKTLGINIPVITLLGDVLNGLLGGGKTSIIDVFSDIVGNRTFVEDVLDHFNETSSASNSTANLFKSGNSRKSKRASPGQSLMWQMLRHSVKSKMAKR